MKFVKIGITMNPHDRIIIVLFRLQASSSAALAITVVAAIGSRTDWAGYFSVVEPGRIRVRALPPSAAGP